MSGDGRRDALVTTSVHARTRSSRAYKNVLIMTINISWTLSPGITLLTNSKRAY